MGVGLIVVCREADVESVILTAAHTAGERHVWRIGSVVRGPHTVEYVAGPPTALPLYR